MIDQNLPRRLTTLLRTAGHDAVHTADEGMATAADPLILSWCCAHVRLLVTADEKLTKFLASSAAECPSVLITRDMRTVPVEQMAAILVANLPQIEVHRRARECTDLTRAVQADPAGAAAGRPRSTGSVS